MKITADNRGRIALSKVWPGTSSKEEPTFGLPYSDWDATVEKGQVVLTPVGVETKEEWGRYYHLSPEDIGTVIGVYKHPEGAIRVPEGGEKDGVFGVLEAYSNFSGLPVDLKLAGMSDRILVDGNMYFWKRN